MTNPELATAKDLDLWARDLTSHFESSILIRRLILATASVAEIDLGAREDVFLNGWTALYRLTAESRSFPRAPPGGKSESADWPGRQSAV